MSVPAFQASMSELLGIKAGLAVGVPELNRLFNSAEMLGKYVDLPDDGWVRLHSSEYEEVVQALLYAVGRLERPYNFIAGISSFHRYRRDETLFPIFESVLSMYTEWLRVETSRPRAPDEKLMDPDSVMRKVAARHGGTGLDMLMELFNEQEIHRYVSPWGPPDSTEWRDTIELKSLFDSEGLQGQYGKFFDQRFIDYINRNFDDIDEVHWRKFEQLAAEYLDRNGYDVELGPGRGDDGVDIRAWPKDEDSALPPALIVQCKRQRAPVEKVVVKALYADMLEENAKRGLVVTTSRLAPGAAKTSSARGYPIDVADRTTLKNWIGALRTPGSGVIV